jgi:diguanylate cyclase (GGDEF)-like protein/PAS domain S-box-containing protein
VRARARPRVGTRLLASLRSPSGLYAAAFRLRDLFLVALAVVVLALPGDRTRAVLVPAALLLVVLPYNAVLRRRLQRTGRVPACLAWADQLLAASFVLVWPDLLAPALIAGMLGVGIAAVMLDRRAALRGAAVGGLLFGFAELAAALMGATLADAHLISLPAYAIGALTTAYVVGTVAGLQRRGQEQLSELLESLQVVVYEMDAETLQVRYISPYLARITGRPVEDYLGDPSAFLGMIHRRDSLRLLEMVGAATEGRRSYDVEYRIFDGQGGQRWVRNLAAVETGPDGRPLIRGSIADISRQKRAEEALAHQARSDDLTGLANRPLLLDVLSAPSERRRLLVFLDLDSFKRINDSLGHQAGDALLVQVAERLRTAVRPGDAVARLGGDEFVVLLDLVDEQDAEAVVRRLQRVFDPPFLLDGRRVRITASAGVALVPAGGRIEARGLLEQADSAMYTAKRTGPGRSAFFNASMREAALQRLDVESEIRVALEQGQFSLVYQPIVRADDRTLVGHEALLRWHHPERGMVPPAQFIPVAEQTGQIVELGRWVLREACAQASRWRVVHGPGLQMSVNLSAVQLSDDELLADVTEALALAALEPSALCLEITETALIAHPEQALVVLQALRDSGITVALDDFGTGYSSLSHLHRYPVDAVKIDRSFVAHLGDGSGKDGIVTAILHLASHMQLSVVAEGVEEQSQARRLAELGCDRLQGYAIARPAPAQESVVLAALPGQRAVPVPLSPARPGGSAGRG